MQLRISLLPGLLAVCRLEPDAEVPSWVRGTFTSVTRTEDELSIVCDDDGIPGDVRTERGWRALKVLGPIPFEMTGVAAALVAPLAEAHISVFLLATFDTDYLLLKEAVLDSALTILRGAGHHISSQEIN
jgi:hypothetical protein